MLLKKRRSQPSKDVERPQYELDHDLSPIERHFMFWEYLEIGKKKCYFTLPLNERKLKNNIQRYSYHGMRELIKTKLNRVKNKNAKVK